MLFILFFEALCANESIIIIMLSKKTCRKIYNFTVNRVKETKVVADILVGIGSMVLLYGKLANGFAVILVCPSTVSESNNKLTVYRSHDECYSSSKWL